jgi:DNA polymerase elongation subunit (family B)
MNKNRNLNIILKATKDKRPLPADAFKPRLPKILTIDIETSPHVAYAWGLYDVNISLSQVLANSRVISFAAKWYDSKQVMFYSEHHNTRKEMIRAAWELFNEADIVITYNGINFDNKHLQREFILAGLTPPSPFKNVDLLRVVRSQFKFASNKLDFVSQQLGIGQKVEHEGQALWNKVLAGDAKAWERMKKYNIQDVRLTESLFDFLGPWVKSMPHVGLWTGERCCFRCGTTDLSQHGFGYTATTVYAKLQCNDCGSWNRLGVVRGRTETKPLR